MNTKYVRLSLLTAFLLPLSPLVRADEAAPTHEVKRVEIQIKGDKTKKLEKAGFLGVILTDLPPALNAQLSIPKNQGLLVTNVRPASPAEGVLEENDILLKFEDQILVTPRQFGVLVRSKKDGDEVNLTLMRAGKQQVVKVKMITKELPAIDATGDEQNTFMFTRKLTGADANTKLDHLRSVMSMTMDGNSGGGGLIQSRTIKAGDGKIPSTMTFSDDEMSLFVFTKDQKTQLEAKAPDGKVLFKGPIDTEEEKKALPEAVAKKLKKIEVKVDFQLEPDNLSGQPSAIVVPNHSSGSNVEIVRKSANSAAF